VLEPDERVVGAQPEERRARAARTEVEEREGDRPQDREDGEDAQVDDRRAQDGRDEPTLGSLTSAEPASPPGRRVDPGCLDRGDPGPPLVEGLVGLALHGRERIVHRF
jgi:hypothetical protein